MPARFSSRERLHRIARSACVVGLLLLVAVPSRGQTDREALEARLKAALVAKVARFVVWPEEARPAADGVLVVGVVGQDETGEALEEFLDASTLKVGGVRFRPVEEASQVLDCHIAWIASSARDRVEEIVEVSRDRPVLLFADGSEMLEHGVHVAVLTAEGRVAFEVNLDALREGGLELPAQMLPLARRLLTHADGGTGR